jgi:hypothetical protein
LTVEQPRALGEPVVLKKREESGVPPTAAEVLGFRASLGLAEPEVLARYLVAAAAEADTSEAEEAAQTPTLVVPMPAAAAADLPIPTQTWFQMWFTLKAYGPVLAR